MIKKAEILIVLFIVLNLCAFNLQAELITIDLTAEIVYIDETYDWFNGQLKVGDFMIGSYAYDSSTLDTDPLGLDTVGQYQHYNAPYGVNLSSGGIIFQTDPQNVEFLITILNNHNGRDEYSWLSYQNLPLINDIYITYIGWGLADHSCAALSNDTLPIIPPVLEDWDFNHLIISGGANEGCYFPLLEARVTNVIPEPATILLLAFGSLLLNRRR
jgi:hypothetical protein